MPPGELKPPLNETTKLFGERMRERRNQLGLSLEAAAVRMGVHWSAAGRLERGQRSVRLETILKIARGLDMDAGQLISGLPIPDDASDD